jgi:DNA-binding MarR family transcriptional regulator
MVDVSESSIRAARDLRVFFSRLRRRMREVASTDDLTAPQTAVLMRLAKDGPASTSELAGAERVRPQSMAATVTGLDRHGLISRELDPHDGRRQVIALTAHGCQRAESDRQVRDEWLVRAFQDRYSEQERQVINEAVALLGRLTDD